MRPLVDAILIGMRTGAQWRFFAKKSTIHEWFQRLSQSGIWKALWILFVEKARAEGKTDVMTDGEGYPIAITLSSANKHDSKMLAATLAARILPLTGVDLVMDNGYRGKPAAMVAIAAGFSPILPPKRGEQKSGEARSPVDPRHKGRWKIERTFAWLTVFRGLQQRLEKKSENHMALLHLWAAIVWWRKLSRKKNV